MVLLCTACEFKLKPNDDDNNAESMKVERYDRLQSRYLITGDFSALQQMNTPTWMISMKRLKSRSEI